MTKNPIERARFFGIMERRTPGFNAIAAAYNAEGLLPYNQLPDITRPDWNPLPLRVERVGSQGQYLLALGLAHRTDLSADNLHYRALTEYTSVFYTVTDCASAITLNEGGVWPNGKYDNLGLAYAQGGEPQWLQMHGEHMTRVLSPDSGHAEGMILRSSGFTREEIACLYFVRSIPQWQRAELKPDFTTYMQERLGRRLGLLGWHDIDPSLPNIVAIYEEIYNKPFDPTDIEFFYQQSVGYMLPSTSRVQDAAITSNMHRDITLLRMVRDIFEEGKSVLVVFGWPHIRALQPALERLGVSGESGLIGRSELGSYALRQYELVP